MATYKGSSATLTYGNRTPPVVVYQQSGGPGGSNKWLNEAHKKDLAIAARKLANEDADEEAVLLVILQAAVEQYYT